MSKVVLCVTLNDDSLDQMKKLKGTPLLAYDEVHLVHCFEVQMYNSDFSPFIYPTEEQYPEIEKAGLEILKSLSENIKASNPELKVFFSQSPHQKMIEYLQEIKADLAVVATRGKHGIEGLFSSSFADHLIKYSPCDIYVIRPRD